MRGRDRGGRSWSAPPWSWRSTGPRCPGGRSGPVRPVRGRRRCRRTVTSTSGPSAAMPSMAAGDASPTLDAASWRARRVALATAGAVAAARGHRGLGGRTPSCCSRRRAAARRRGPLPPTARVARCERARRSGAGPRGGEFGFESPAAARPPIIAIRRRFEITAQHHAPFGTEGGESPTGRTVAEMSHRWPADERSDGPKTPILQGFSGLAEGADQHRNARSGRRSGRTPRGRGTARRCAGRSVRSGWDLNPRRSCPLTSLAGMRLQPDSATTPRSSRA